MKVCEVMSDSVLCVDMEETVLTAAKLMLRRDLGALPVCDGEGKLRGMLTDRDIVLRCVAAGQDCSRTRVAEIMSRGVTTAGPFDELERAVELMSRDQVRRLPVLSSGRLVGLLSLCDLARNCNCDAEAAEALAEVSSNFRRLL